MNEQFVKQFQNTFILSDRSKIGKQTHSLHKKMKKSLIENFIVRAVIGKTHKNGYLANLIMLNSTIMESTNSDFPRFE